VTEILQWYPGVTVAKAVATAKCFRWSPHVAKWNRITAIGIAAHDVAECSDSIAASAGAKALMLDIDRAGSEQTDHLLSLSNPSNTSE